MSVDGRKEFVRQFGRIESNTGNTAFQAVSKGIRLVQANAKYLCPVGDGELRDSIYATVETDSNMVRGSCYTNKKHGPYVELGTGPKGQADHDGISPAVNPVYTQSPWWIHESQIDKATVEKYHMFSIETKDGIFYKSSGQAAQPFMYPALKNNEDEIIKEIETEWGKSLKGV